MSDTTPQAATDPVVTPIPALNIDAPATVPESPPADETVAEADKPETVDETDKPEDPPRDTKGKFAKRAEKLQSQIDTMVWRKRTAEAEAIAAETRADELRKAAEAAPTHDPNDFAAADAHRLRTVIKTEQAEQIDADAAAARQRAADIQAQTFNLAVEAAVERIPDIQDVLSNYTGPKVPPFAVDVLTESPKAAEIAYHLAKNPAITRSLQSMSPAQQGAEIARLEARLTVAPQARKTTQAPPPPPSLGGNRSPAVKDPSDMSVAELQAYLAKAH